MGKKCREIPTKISWLSQKSVVISIYLVSISLDDLNKNLDTAKSQLKSLNFKNLNREKKKLISTVKKISTLQKS